MASNDTDYYTLLGVEKSASEADIKKAYRKLALQWHPDKNPNNVEESKRMFQLISEAYDVLSNPQKRREYDTYGKTGAANIDANFMHTRNANDIFREVFANDPLLNNFFNNAFGGNVFGGFDGGAFGPGFSSSTTFSSTSNGMDPFGFGFRTPFVHNHFHSHFAAHVHAIHRQHHHALRHSMHPYFRSLQTPYPPVYPPFFFVNEPTLSAPQQQQQQQQQQQHFYPPQYVPQPPPPLQPFFDFSTFDTPLASYTNRFENNFDSRPGTSFSSTTFSSLGGGMPKGRSRSVQTSIINGVKTTVVTEVDDKGNTTVTKESNGQKFVTYNGKPAANTPLLQ